MTAELYPQRRTHRSEFVKLADEGLFGADFPPRNQRFRMIQGGGYDGMSHGTQNP